MAADQTRSASDDVLTARAAETINQGLNRIRGKLTDGIESSRDVIREDPLKAVLISAGVGAIVGFLLGRSISNK